MRRHRSACVRPQELDQRSAALLARAQAATGEVLRSPALLAGHVDAPATAAVLAAREWELASMLRGLSRAGSAGFPLCCREDVAAVAGSAARRVADLEAYAGMVRAVGQACDGLAAPRDELLDLLAATATDAQASSEVAGLARDAGAALRELSRLAQDS
jgi:hypothetical protein